MSAWPAVDWSLSPSILAGFGAWTLVYERLTRRTPGPRRFRRAAFHLGTLTALLALVSPLDGLGDRYLFSAHMLQHLLLMFAAAPLWWIGVSGEMLDRIIPRSLDGAARFIGAPAAAFGIFVFVLWIWHIPAFFGLALENESVHIFEHLSFIGAAIAGWRPVLGPDTERFPCPPAPARMLYLFLLALPCTALAALLTFAPDPLYAFYIAAGRVFLPGLPVFGLDALQDQRLGGLLMWLPTHLVLLTALGATFFRWFSTLEDPPTDELQKMGV